MDIFNNNYRMVKCINNSKELMKRFCSDNHLLEIGKTYHVVNVFAYDCYTEIELEEFPNKKFNSVDFEEIDN